MSFTAIIASLCCILIETVQQLSFALSSKETGGITATSLTASPAPNKVFWLSLGIILHIGVLGSWYWMLTLLPLSLAAPLMGGSYATTTLASQWLLKEQVSLKRWLGVICITLGLMIIWRVQPNG
ncbi:MAG: hypothetical protein K2X01_03445 [Cyanobacteria bacterium]|nr:hypothetical protein [Cyanobacteriota bacterium]